MIPPQSHESDGKHDVDCLRRKLDFPYLCTCALTDEQVQAARAPVRESGKLASPYPVERCANDECTRLLSEDTGGAYLFKNRVSGKLCIFCEDCAAYVELNARQQFALVEL